MHTRVHTCTHVHTHAITHIHTPQTRVAQSRYKITHLPPSGSKGLPSPHEGIREEDPEPSPGREEVRGAHAAHSPARSGAGRAKGVGFLVSKEARAKLPLLAEASLRERESLFPFREQSHKSRALPRFRERGRDEGCLVGICLSVRLWPSPPSPSISTSL